MGSVVPSARSQDQETEGWSPPVLMSVGIDRGCVAGDEGEPADEVDVVVRDLGERLGCFVRLQAEVGDDAENLAGLLGGIVGCTKRRSERAKDSLRVGRLESVHGLVDGVLIEPPWV